MKKTQPSIGQAQEHLKRAYENLTELRRHKLNDLRHVEDKIDAMNPAVHALFDKRKAS